MARRSFNYKEGQICSNEWKIKPSSRHPLPCNCNTRASVVSSLSGGETLNLVMNRPHVRGPHMFLPCESLADVCSQFVIPSAKIIPRGKSVYESVMSPCHRFSQFFFFFFFFIPPPPPPPRSYADTSESASLGPDSHRGSLCPVGSQTQTCSDNLNQSASLALAVTQDIERQAEEMHT